MSSSSRPDFVVHVSAVLSAAFVAALLLAPGLLGKSISDAALACGGERNTVQAEFDLDSGADLWREFPAMLRAPELEEVAGPVHVVVFKGTFDLSGMIGGRSGPIPPVADAICVMTAAGEINLYDGVSRAGSKYGG